MFGIKEKVRTVRELPNQIKFTVNLAISALIVAIVALVLAGVGVSRNAH